MRIFSELNDTQVLINSSGTITIEVHSSGNLRIFDATTTDATSEGVDYHLYFQYDAQTQTYDFRLDGVSLTPGSGLNVSVNSGGDCALNSTLNLFSLTNGTQPFIGDFGDLWVHCTDNPQGYSSFADESGQPKDLSSLPTPDIWLGGDLTAADINSGDNLGLVPTPLDVVAGNFTDL
ncbi:MAG: hypothetical protein Unbinned200contig1000_13 [Prokaryotic dsDNA virus sp.]|jgi:hypothetical protein|nr:hypothetical protein [Flavobacteriaceae bacterium]QDP65273.1 MAG: hypothetical protein Unbinned200contig1000_13 [Prokaryotic dsDNA virus sp.]|tara:strand:+ start:22042 stop:22572 length:531 start_codon:yes stop_codon:yes gene_type:complete